MTQLIYLRLKRLSSLLEKPVLRASILMIPKKVQKTGRLRLMRFFLRSINWRREIQDILRILRNAVIFWSLGLQKKGTMGHHFSIPYNGGGLIVINVQAHLAWALAEKCGHPINEEAWGNSFSEVKKSRDPKTGALGYSSRARWSPDISARTGAMIAALMVAGREEKFASDLANSLYQLNRRMRHAHAMSSIGLILVFSVASRQVPISITPK